MRGVIFQDWISYVIHEANEEALQWDGTPDKWDGQL